MHGHDGSARCVGRAMQKDDIHVLGVEIFAAGARLRFAVDDAEIINFRARLTHLFRDEFVIELHPLEKARKLTPVSFQSHRIYTDSCFHKALPANRFRMYYNTIAA